jgi:glycosyltransferase involved in cell wall biosynthesis
MRDQAAISSTRLICFSHLRWNFVFQRPQHLMSRAAQTHDVIFLEEPVTNSQNERQLKFEQPVPKLTVVTPNVPAGADETETQEFIRASLEQFLDTHPAKQTIAWYYSPMMRPIGRNIYHNVCVYDCMDELSAFKDAPPQLRLLERELLQDADLVFTGGVSLYQAKRDLHSDVHAFPSSIDRQHFEAAKSSGIQEPADQAGIAHPRIGFFGVIDERMDLELVRDLAQLRPDIQFVMLGPVVKIQERSLPRLSNLHWLGQKNYRDLPSYLAFWDAGFMPFAINDSTRYISPTKTPEFLAAGIPVVSSAITDVVRPYGENNLVEIANSAQEFSESIDRLIAHPRDLWQARVKRMLSQSSWDTVWADMSKLITAKLPKTRIPSKSKIPQDKHV